MAFKLKGFPKHAGVGIKRDDPSSELDVNMVGTNDIGSDVDGASANPLC